MFTLESNSHILTQSSDKLQKNMMPNALNHSSEVDPQMKVVSAVKIIKIIK
jgi:hypothetical protein